MNFDSPFIIPLAGFAMVALIVALVNMLKLRDQEMQVRQRLFQENLEHQRKMKELDVEMERAKRG